MKLYDYELSGNCYKIRLFCALLGLDIQRLPVNFYPGKEHKSEKFLAEINPMGQLPVIDDDGFILRDAQAILVYLAERYDRTGVWWPSSPEARGLIQTWLSFSDDLTRTASAARLHDALGYTEIDVHAARKGAHKLLRYLDDHLAVRHFNGSPWLHGGSPSIADIACFPYVALAPEGGISLDEYPDIRQWIWDVRSLPRFVGMGGIMAIDIGQDN
ncbi:MAG: glutathione S-transferase family protein [Proteobacteria bacterium]|uniref:glutathione S-transferase family protein n=1 Tax=Zoogloea sp. LCSB751 TaxID=1965277 RepID=UPI0009A4B6A7|nr:glutathione S-transferase family protein [Zoogloea sp. LCSB751]MBS0353521.1 glutathione S-transferase family protein [Pseudomonadota bacterium]